MKKNNAPEPKTKRTRRKAVELPPKELLDQLFAYNPKTGDLRWKIKIPNKPNLYEPVGHMDFTGYLSARIKGKMFRVHRLIWMLHHGEDPGLLHVDHINGIKNDNRIDNLRLVTQFQNACNSKLSVNNTSGVKGVSWMPRFKRWQAYINHEGKRFALGQFKEFDQAVRKIKETRNQLHGEFQHKPMPTVTSKP